MKSAEADTATRTVGARWSAEVAMLLGQKIISIGDYRNSLDSAPTPHEEFDQEKIRASAEIEKGSTHVLFWVEDDGNDGHIYHREYYKSFEDALSQANENKGIVTQ